MFAPVNYAFCTGDGLGEGPGIRQPVHHERTVLHQFQRQDRRREDGLSKTSRPPRACLEKRRRRRAIAGSGDTFTRSIPTTPLTDAGCIAAATTSKRPRGFSWVNGEYRCTLFNTISDRTARRSIAWVELGGESNGHSRVGVGGRLEANIPAASMDDGGRNRPILRATTSISPSGGRRRRERAGNQSLRMAEVEEPRRRFGTSDAVGRPRRIRTVATGFCRPQRLFGGRNRGARSRRPIVDGSHRPHRRRQHSMSMEGSRANESVHVRVFRSRSSTFRRLAGDSPVTGEFSTCACRLYGESAHLFKDKLIFKPAGVEGYRLHQDWISWTGFPRRSSRSSCRSTTADRTNGCTVVYPGCHTADTSVRTTATTTLPRILGRGRRSRSARIESRRYRDFRCVRAALFRSEPQRQASAATLPQLQRRLRRRRPARTTTTTSSTAGSARSTPSTARPKSGIDDG